MKRTEHRADDDKDSLFDLLLRAFINGFMLKLFEKIGERVGEWCAYRLINHSDPSYYTESNEK